MEMDSSLVLKANAASITRLLENYLEPPEYKSATWDLFGVPVFGREISNRRGVPDDARTFELNFEGPDWAMLVRTVWRGAHLYAPTAIHTVIVAYDAPDDQARCEPVKAAARVNDWLMGLPL